MTAMSTLYAAQWISRPSSTRSAAEEGEPDTQRTQSSLRNDAAALPHHQHHHHHHHQQLCNYMRFTTNTTAHK